MSLTQQRKLPIEAALLCNKQQVVRYFVEEAGINLNILDYVTRRKIKLLIGGRTRGNLAFEYGMNC